MNRLLQLTLLFVIALCSAESFAFNTQDSAEQTGSIVSSEEVMSQKIDLNSATAEQLVLIKGIGPSKAAAIIKYRREIGGFTAVEELLEVKGIGQKALANLKQVLTI